MNELNLSSLNDIGIPDLNDFIKNNMKNNREIRSIDYKKKIFLNFNSSFKNFLIFFSKKHNCDLNNNLKNFLAPWWLQAIFLKMDREIIANNIIESNIKIFYVDKKIQAFEFLNHTQIKNEIGDNEILNKFIIALILKNKISHKIINTKIKINLNISKRKKKLKKIFLNQLIIFYLNFISKFKKLKLNILSDTSYYNKIDLIKKIFLCQILPIFILPEDDAKEKKVFNYNDQNIDNFLYEIFSSKLLIDKFNDDFKIKISKNININKFISHKGYLNYLDIRSIFERLKLTSHNFEVYSHGGLFDAIWTEDEISAKVVNAKWIKSKQLAVNDKYYIKQSNDKNGILITLLGHSKFVSRFRSGITHYEFIHEYQNELENLLINLDTRKRNYILRLPPDRGIDINLEKYVLKGFKIDENADIRQTLSKVRIHMPTYNATLPFYSLINDIPSIFFWKKNHFPLPNKFDSIISDLIKAKILCEDSLGICHYLNNNSDNQIIDNWKDNSYILNRYKSLIF